MGNYIRTYEVKNVQIDEIANELIEQYNGIFESGEEYVEVVNESEYRQNNYDYFAHTENFNGVLKVYVLKNENPDKVNLEIDVYEED